MSLTNERIDKCYLINNYPKLNIIGVKPSDGVGNIYRMNNYIMDYPFSKDCWGFITSDLRLHSGCEGNWGGDLGHYLLTNILNNTVRSSDGYHEPSGIILSIDYVEFLNFLNQTDITLKTIYDTESCKIQYEFLSYPNFIESKYDEYLLNRLFVSGINKKILGIGTLVENKNMYHMGKNVFQEFDSYLDKNNGEKVRHVRMLMKDNIYHWVRITSIKWNIEEENNRIVSNNIVLPFDYPFRNDAESCTQYINEVLYKEMKYHPDLYISEKISDKFFKFYQLYKYRKYLEIYSQNSKYKSRIIRR